MFYGIGITSSSNLNELNELRNQYDKKESEVRAAKRDLLLAVELTSTGVIAKNQTIHLQTLIQSSKSQLRQDLFCMIANDWKYNGYFVEFGAVDGVDGSNTFALETKFGWTGILSEPNSQFHQSLISNRNCQISTFAIGGQVQDHRNFVSLGNLGTFEEYRKADDHDRSRGVETLVKTTTLGELLDQFQAPRRIDYLSVDTEGSELEIFSAFDFSTYRFNFVSVEHNFSPSEKELRTRFEKNGYVQIARKFSEFDLYFVDENLAHKFAPLL